MEKRDLSARTARSTANNATTVSSSIGEAGASRVNPQRPPAPRRAPSRSSSRASKSSIHPYPAHQLAALRLLASRSIARDRTHPAGPQKLKRTTLDVLARTRRPLHPFRTTRGESQQDTMGKETPKHCRESRRGRHTSQRQTRDCRARSSEIASSTHRRPSPIRRARLMAAPQWYRQSTPPRWARHCDPSLLTPPTLPVTERSAYD